jgi:hypothetical protein
MTAAKVSQKTVRRFGLNTKMNAGLGHRLIDLRLSFRGIPREIVNRWSSLRLTSCNTSLTNFDGRGSQLPHR